MSISIPGFGRKYFDARHGGRMWLTPHIRCAKNRFYANWVDASYSQHSPYDEVTGLFSNKISLFVLPGPGCKIRQYSCPRYIPFLAILFLLGVSAGGCWLVRDYLSLKASMPRLEALQEENTLNRDGFIKLAKRIETFRAEMGELRALDEKLKGMVDFEVAGGESKFYGIGGSVPSLLDPDETLKKLDKNFIGELNRSMDRLHDAAAFSKQNKRSLNQFLDEQKRRLASTPSIWPTRGWLSSRFGQRISPFTGKKEFHEGIDISTRMSTPIVSTANGRVAFSGWERGYGRVVRVDHGHGLETKYAHLKKSLVKKGQLVKRGDRIALVGNSGKSTGSHLHYEVHVNGQPVNPLRYILD